MSTDTPDFSPIKAPRARRQSALRHINRSASLDEPFMPQLMRFSIIAISVAVGLFLCWAATTEISEVTRAEGEVVPSGYVQVVQHLEGGIVDKILVREGELVEQGQPLLLLDGVGAREDLAKSQEQLRALRIEEERLHSLLEGKTPDFAALSTEERSAMNQQRSYDATIAAREKEAEIIRQQIGQKQQMLASLESRRQTLVKNVRLSEESLGAMQTLMEKGLANRFRFLSQQEETNRQRGQLAEVNSDISAAEQGILEYEQRLASLEANYRDQAAQSASRVELEISQLEEVINKLQGRVNRLEVRAPTRGLVKGLQVHTVGAVLGSGEQIAEIVPIDAQMVVEAKISTSDIGHIRVGQPVQIKVHSFDFVRYGMVEGTLESVSPTTFIDKLNKTYYRARIILRQPYVGEVAGKNLVLPGMTVESDIMTGTKTVMDYLLKPIHVAASTAMQER